MRNSFLIALLISVSFCACETVAPKIPIADEKSLEDQVIDYIDEIISAEWKESSTEVISLDSIQGFVEYESNDSTYRHIYLGLKTKEASLVNRLFKQIKDNFDAKYGKRKCDDTFCSWKEQKSKSRRLELMIMNESLEKKHPYLVIEIEEINE